MSREEHARYITTKAQAAARLIGTVASVRQHRRRAARRTKALLWTTAGDVFHRATFGCARDARRINPCG
jgi:hypothetical protein